MEIKELGRVGETRKCYSLQPAGGKPCRDPYIDCQVPREKNQEQQVIWPRERALWMAEGEAWEQSGA